MIEETLGRAASAMLDDSDRVYGVVVGRVINMLDPMTLGRLQVQLPFIDSLDLSPWARVAVPMAGLLHGTYFIPNLGDEVLVVFEHGDVNVPYIIGCLWNATAPPPLPSPVPQIRAIRTLAGNQLVFTEVPPSITLQTAAISPLPMPTPPSPTGPHQTIMMSPLGVQIVSPSMIQLVSPTAVQLVCGSNILSLTPDGLNIVAANITITSSAAVSIQAGGTCGVLAPLITLN
jgi:hypothetical protein